MIPMTELELELVLVLRRRESIRLRSNAPNGEKSPSLQQTVLYEPPKPILPLTVPWLLTMRKL
jgi:hypothetical protein